MIISDKLFVDPENKTHKRNMTGNWPLRSNDVNRSYRAWVTLVMTINDEFTFPI